MPLCRVSGKTGYNAILGVSVIVRGRKECNFKRAFFRTVLHVGHSIRDWRIGFSKLRFGAFVDRKITNELETAAEQNIPCGDREAMT